MKVAFICSSVEPGRDGVGDYTRGLADELVQQGHSASIVALNDPHVSKVTEENDCPLAILRLPSTLPWNDRVRRSRVCSDAFDPDWISLQFVCYGFHPRGLCWSAAGNLREIIGTRPVQIMFHELWIGSGENRRLKDRIIGTMQRACAMRLYSRLNISHTLTTNPGYAALLNRHGVTAKVLPLFGSVPVPSMTSIPERSTSWRFLMFGALHPVWPPEPLFTYLRALDRKVEIVHAGRISYGAALWEKMTREYGEFFNFRRLGEMMPEKLTEILSNVDFGIATTPWEIIGKSASVATMLEHGLPVIVNRDDNHYAGWREEGYDEQLIKMAPDILERLHASRRRQPKSRRGQVALRFLDELRRT